MTTSDKELRDKQILIVGFGRSGVAAANLSIHKGASVTITDLKPESELSRQIPLLKGPVRLSLGFHAAEDFRNADLIVVSPGVPTRLPPLLEAQEAQIPIISEIELAFRLLEGTIVGITGSNGKTTTTTLIGEVLAKAGRPAVVAGNIGAPLSEAVLRQQGVRTLYVVELSSFQLETIDTFRCHIALLLNVTADHLDRYANMEAYQAAKERIFLNQTPPDFAVFNAGNPPINPGLAMPFPFSLSKPLVNGVFVDGEHIMIAHGGRPQRAMRVEEITLRGKHNLENVLAALAAVHLLGIDPEPIASTIQSFPGIEHRMEWVRSYRKVDYINDSKATNVDAAMRAIESFDRPQIVIMGGLDKKTDFSPLRRAVSARVRKVILIGKAAKTIQLALADCVETVHAGGLTEAVECAASLARPGEVVLLAPACASFDMFRDYEERGKRFKQIVYSLGNNEKKPATEVRRA